MTYFHINETIFNEIWPIDVGYNPKDIKHDNISGIKNNFPYFLMHYVVSGKCYVTIDGITKSFTKGQIFFIFPNCNVEYKGDSKVGWEYYWINFNGTKAIDLLRKIGITKNKYFQDNKIEKAKKYFKSSLESKDNERSSSFIVLSNIISIFGLLAENNNDLSTLKNDDFYVTEYIINYIQENLYSHNLTAAGVSAHFHLNPKYFSTLFKKKFNVSFKEYVNYERIKKASELFETTNQSSKYVAESVGFNDCLYFSKVFKRYRLMPPSEYIKNKRK